MEKLHIYKPEDLPENIKTQIISFLRIEWPDGFMGPNRLRNWVSYDYEHSINFILEEEEILISHLEVVWKYMKHCSKTYKVYGLTGVFTYPQFRKQGYGLRLLKEAKKYIKEQGDADIVMFNSDKLGFYDRAGFIPMKNVVTLVGDPGNPKRDNSIAFMLFISEKGKAGKEDFENYPVYVGSHTW